MAIIKLNNKAGPVLVNPAHIVYVQAVEVTNKAGGRVSGSRIVFTIPTKHATRDAHLLDVLEAPTAVEALIARAK